METCLRQLRSHIRQHKLSFYTEGPLPCLEALWRHYNEYHNTDTEAVRQGFRSLKTYTEILPPRLSDTVLAEVGCLCSECERAAFIAGLRPGAQLKLEIED